MKIAALSSRAVAGSVGTDIQKLGYQGAYAEEVEEFGLGYNEFQLRNYDPQIGRFMNADPFCQYASPYLGMGNDPANLNDPSGGFTISMLGGAALGAVIGAGIGAIASGGEMEGIVAGAFLGAALGGAICEDGLSIGLETISSTTKVAKAGIALSLPAISSVLTSKVHGPNIDGFETTRASGGWKTQEDKSFADHLSQQFEKLNNLLSKKVSNYNDQIDALGESNEADKIIQKRDILLSRITEIKKVIDRISELQKDEDHTYTFEEMDVNSPNGITYKQEDGTVVIGIPKGSLSLAAHEITHAFHVARRYADAVFPEGPGDVGLKYRVRETNWTYPLGDVDCYRAQWAVEPSSLLQNIDNINQITVDKVIEFYKQKF